MEEQFYLFENWIKEEKLLYVEVIVQKKGRKVVFGRLLKLDAQARTMLIYDVDQKEVLSVMMNQIDRIQPAGAVV